MLKFVTTEFKRFVQKPDIIFRTILPEERVHETLSLEWS